MVLTCNVVPISLVVQMGIVKSFQAYFIASDEQMIHRPSNTGACPRSSELNEELGQVKYLFTDKTGTLTQNIMQLKKCCIGGKIVPIKLPSLLASSSPRSSYSASALISFSHSSFQSSSSSSHTLLIITFMLTCPGHNSTSAQFGPPLFLQLRPAIACATTTSQTQSCLLRWQAMATSSASKKENLSTIHNLNAHP
eukprot:GHVT01043448.1.p1 GENE.GHVT01043448.1~~GHVT01043448.1.p1  ORF type:complete len:196 (+),score=17.96 GHVT01043448.1:193-780(+)